MKINNINFQNNLSFKGGTLNILAMADNHGKINTLHKVANSVDKNFAQIFQNPNNKCTTNIFAIVGDFFLNPIKKGILTKNNSSKQIGDIQCSFLSKFIKHLKSHFENHNLQTLFALGNHDLDGGDDLTMKYMSSLAQTDDVTTIVTNINLDKSSSKTQAWVDNRNIVKSKIVEIQDDKKVDLKHQVLFLEVTIPGIEFTNPGILENIRFFDHSKKKDIDHTKDDLKETFQALSDTIENFKKEHPKGPVIILSHTGNNISKLLCENVKGIDIVLNGHDHVETTTFLENSSKIYSLSQNNQLIRSLNISFDDEGNFKLSNIDGFKEKPLETDFEPTSNVMEDFLMENLGDDLKPKLKVVDYNYNPSQLKFDELEIRTTHSELANFLTSAIKYSILKSHSVSSIGLLSGSVRGPLVDCGNNFDLLSLFSTKENLATLSKGSLTSDELTTLIVGNVVGNILQGKRSPIYQWSDFKINKTQIGEIHDNSNLTETEKQKLYKSAIQYKNPKTSNYESLSENIDYTIVIPKKCLDNEVVNRKEISYKFENLEKNFTFHNLLIEYLIDNNYTIKIDKNILEKRII